MSQQCRVQHCTEHRCNGAAAGGRARWSGSAAACSAYLDGKDGLGRVAETERLKVGTAGRGGASLACFQLSNRCRLVWWRAHVLQLDSCRGGREGCYLLSLFAAVAGSSATRKTALQLGMQLHLPAALLQQHLDGALGVWCAADHIPGHLRAAHGSWSGTWRGRHSCLTQRGGAEGCQRPQAVIDLCKPNHALCL